MIHTAAGMTEAGVTGANHYDGEPKHIEADRQTQVLPFPVSRPEPRRYVCGFCFDAKIRRVLLIRKARPIWHAGRLNGIGGKRAAGERPEDAMLREFVEETGISGLCWHRLIVLNGIDDTGTPWTVHFFYASCADDAIFDRGKNADQDEPLEHCDPFNLPPEVIFNLRWLIPLAMDRFITKPLPDMCERSRDELNVEPLPSWTSIPPQAVP